MVFGIYARKSLHSDQSDSVENQVLLAEEYIEKHYPAIEKQVIYYIDEDRSGGDMFRPDWERLISDMRNHVLDIIVCYKLDRVGRDVADLALFYREIVQYDLVVIPVRDNLEIKEDMTPVEKGMMYMNAVFSQIERENTIVRVSDNMIKLAEKGYWCGGRPPIGFQLQRVMSDNMRMHTILVENPSTVPFLHKLVHDFLNEGLSLGGMETKYRKEKFVTPLGATLTGSQIWVLLTNPNYVAADGIMYDYYASMGCKMAKPRESFDGQHGIIAYCRGRGAGKGMHKRKRILNPPEKWIISVGHHKPILDSQTFLSIQERFGQNIIDKTRKHKIGILKGVLRCSCGRLMRTKYKYDKKYNIEYQHYYCPGKDRLGPEYCSTKMIRLDDIDAEVIQQLTDISLDYTLIDQYISPVIPIPSLRSRSVVEKELRSVQNKISNLTQALANTDESPAAKYIISSIETLDAQITKLKKELYDISLAENKARKREVDKMERYQMVCHIIERLDVADYDEINGLIRELFAECVWDGEKLRIKM